MDGVGDGRMAPVALGCELLFVVLRIVQQQVHAVAQLEHALSDPHPIERGLVIRQIGDRQSTVLDAKAEGEVGVRDIAGCHLDIVEHEVIVSDLVELHLAAELLHLHREERGCHC